MEITILRADWSEFEPTVYLTVYGTAADGHIKQATIPYSYDPENILQPEDWLAAHLVEAQAAIDAAPYNESFERQIMAQLAQEAWANLPNWLKDWTPAQAKGYIHQTVFNGYSKAEADAWIDANVTGTNLATALASIRAALKIIAGAVIDDRDVVDSEIAGGELLLRDILKLK